MFDLSFAELIVVAIVALLVIGPAQMPTALKHVVRTSQKVKRYIQEMKQAIVDSADLGDLASLPVQLQQEKRYIIDQAGNYQEVFDVSELMELSSKENPLSDSATETSVTSRHEPV